MTERGLFTPRQLEILSLVAKGFSASEIGQELYIAANTVKRNTFLACQRSGTHSAEAAIVMAVRHQELDLDTLLPGDYNFDRFQTLTRGQKSVLEVFTDHDGIITRRGLATILHLSPNTIKRHMKAIYASLKINNKTQFLVLCLAAQRKGFL